MNLPQCLSRPELWLLLGLVSGLSAQREVVDFDFGWRFSKGEISGAGKVDFDDSTWRTVDLPHDWGVEDLEPLPPAKQSLTQQLAWVLSLCPQA